MAFLTCARLRTAVALAVLLFVVGLILQVPRLLLGADLPSISVLSSGVGLFFVVLSPLIMLVTTLLALLPGAARELALCRR